MRRTLSLLLLVPVIATLALASGACSDDDDDPEATATGTAIGDMQADEGGDLGDADVAQSVSIEMRDFEFIPATFEVKAGDVVEIAFTNMGSVTHDFTIEDADLDSMMMGEMEMVEGHADDEGMAMHVPLEMGHQAMARMRVHEPGEYVFYCTVAGHRELGMEGTLRVN